MPLYCCTLSWALPVPFRAVIVPSQAAGGAAWVLRRVVPVVGLALLGLIATFMVLSVSRLVSFWVVKLIVYLQGLIYIHI